MTNFYFFKWNTLKLENVSLYEFLEFEKSEVEAPQSGKRHPNDQNKLVKQGGEI